MGWAIIIAGWIANHLFSEIRDRRKEIRSQLDSLIINLDEFRKDAIQFHCSINFDKQKASDLLFLIRKIEGTALRILIIDEQSIAFHVKRIRQAATLKNFDPSIFREQEYSGPIVTSIQLDVEEFITTLESGYERKFPNHFPYYK